MTALIDVPPGLNGVAVADTAIGDVRGDEGFYHYRGLDATALARTHTFEEVWYLLHEGRLPTSAEADAFTRSIAMQRFVPAALVPISSRRRRPPVRVVMSCAPPLGGHADAGPWMA